MILTELLLVFNIGTFANNQISVIASIHLFYSHSGKYT